MQWWASCFFLSLFFFGSIAFFSLFLSIWRSGLFYDVYDRPVCMSPPFPVYLCFIHTAGQGEQWLQLVKLEIKLE